MLSTDKNLREILLGSGTAFLVRSVSVVMAYLMAVAATRLLGATAAGHFFLMSTVVLFVATIARAGMEEPLVRFVATHHADSDDGAVNAVYSWAALRVLLSSAVACALLLLVGPWLLREVIGKPVLVPYLTTMAWAVPAVALYSVQSRALQGLRKFFASLATQNFFPAFIGLIGLYFLVPVMGNAGAAIAYVVAAVCALSFGLWSWLHHRPDAHGQAVFDREQFWDRSKVVLGISVLQLLTNWIALFFLEAFSTSGDVAVYNAAFRTALLITFVKDVINGVAGPKYAALYAHGKMEELATVARNTTRVMTLLAVPVGILVMLFANPIMSIFGREFDGYGHVLTILAVSSTLSVVLGSLAYLLLMSGHERDVRRNLAFTTATSVTLGLVLTYNFGVTGAAVATAAAKILMLVLCARDLRRRLGFSTFGG